MSNIELYRLQCREIENEVFVDKPGISRESQFRAKARIPWYSYIQHNQKVLVKLPSFQEFWNSPESYPRTIAAT